MKQHVCFITPPSAFLLDERVFPNLGILKVAAALMARGYPAEHLDLDGVENFEDVAAAHIGQSAATHIAITATTPQMPAVAKVIRAIRKANATIPIILGGPHPTLAQAALAKSTRAQRAMAQLQELADVIVAGDGEDAIERALTAAHGTIINADDPKGPLFLTRKRLEELPAPARHLIDLKSYHYSIDGVPATTMIAQLGCPFACAFCGGRASPMLRRARMRSTESVLAEIEYLYTTYGYRGLMMYDDELNVNPKVNELMRGIAALAKRLGTEFRLRGFVKAELFTQEQAYAMYEAGFRWLLCGFESGHPRILDNINKKATVSDNDNMLTFARAAGLKVKALMSIGHAGESAETIEATKQWLLSRHVDDFDCTIITPYPGSPYYDEAIEGHGFDGQDMGIHESVSVWTYTAPRTGDRLHAFEVDYTKDADYYKGGVGEYVSHVFTDHITPEDLVTARDALERDVRAALGIPFNPGQAAIRYEHTMGQAGALPANILRSSE